MNRTSVALIRGAFDPDYLAKVYEHAIDSFNAQLPKTDKDYLRHKQGVAIDQTRFDTMWQSVWYVASKVLVDNLRDYPLVSYPSQIRWVRHEHQIVPWHQDYISESHIGKVVTCFVPLNDFPSKYCTLAFSNAGDDIGELEHEKCPNYKGFRMKEEPGNDWGFHLERGDCIIFGDLVPHRTFVTPSMALGRVSLEFRLIAEHERKLSKDYLNIVTKEMIPAAT